MILIVPQPGRIGEWEEKKTLKDNEKQANFTWLK